MCSNLLDYAVAAAIFAASLTLVAVGIFAIKAAIKS
jgi:hypothetical protein